MNPTDTLSKSEQGEYDLAGMRAIRIVCIQCGEGTPVRISDSTLRSIPLVCPDCGSSFAEDRGWLTASLEALGEAVKYAALVQNSRIVVRSGH